MKNSKFVKILAFIAAIVLTVGVTFAFCVSADEVVADADLAVAGKNVVYGDTLTIQYAVSTSKASSAAKLAVADKNGTLGSTSYSEIVTTDKITGVEDSYYVFEVSGIPASDVCEEITVNVVDGEKVGPAMKYSLAEYFFERLYSDGIVNAAEGKALYQKKLYLSYLDYAANAQDLFHNFEKQANETLVTDRFYLNVEGGAVEGLAAGVYEPGSKVTITPADSATKAWKLTKYSFVDGVLKTDTKTVAAGAEIALDANTIVTPGEVVPGMYYEVYGGLNYSVANAYAVAKDGYAFGTYNYSSSSFTGYTLYDKTSYETTQNRLHLNLASDPKDSANKVLWVHRHNEKDNVDFVQSNKKTGMTSGNCFVYETRFMLVDTTGVANRVTASNPYDYIMTLQLSKTSGTTGSWAGSGNGEVIGKIWAKINAEGGYTYYLSSNNHVDTSANGGELKIGEWNTITIEVYDNGKEIQYVNGNRINYKTVNSNGFDLDASYDSVLIDMRYGIKDGAGVYYDNTFVGFINKECVPD